MDNQRDHYRLDRSKIFPDLEKLLENTSEYLWNEDNSLSLALNSPWGTGKTTFLNEWKEYLEGKGYKVIYYNAWDTDSFVDPLISLVYAFANELENINNTTSEKMKYIISQMKKYAIQSGIKYVTKKIGGEIQEIVDDLIREVGCNSEVEDSNQNKFTKFVKDAMKGHFNEEEIKKLISIDKFYEILNARNDNIPELKDYKVYLKQRENFKLLFSTLIEHYSSESKLKDTKIVFMIDELDRCNPPFAIGILETVKHLMNVNGLSYVFGIDLSQLAFSISTLYGHNMDSSGYLRRFFHLQIELEKGSHVYREYIYKLIKDDIKTINYEAVISVSDFFSLSLRDIEFLVNNIILLNKRKEVNYAYAEAIYFLIALKYVDPDIYHRLLFTTFTFTKITKPQENVNVSKYFNELSYHLIPKARNLLGELQRSNLTTLADIYEEKEQFLTLYNIIIPKDKYHNHNYTIGEILDLQLSYLYD